MFKFSKFLTTIYTNEDHLFDEPKAINEIMTSIENCEEMPVDLIFHLLMVLFAVLHLP
jgi:hypothetical protein